MALPRARLAILLLGLSVLVLSLRARAWFVQMQQEDDPLQQEHIYQTDLIHLKDWAALHHRILISSKKTTSAAVRQPGSKPPQCHNDCPGCPGECVARPSYISGAHGSVPGQQAAVWTCICIY